MRTALLLAALSDLAVYLAGSPTAAAPVPKHLMKGGDDRDKLQGRWQAESVRSGSSVQTRDGGLETVVEFRGDEYTATVSRAGVAQLAVTAKVTFDTAGGVKRLSFTGGRRFTGGKPDPEPDAAVGYALDGDRLTLAYRLPGGGKLQEAVDPTKPGTCDTVFVFTRAKPDPGK
ncbi:MAG: hypothetical protein C0501_02055 [Isosphaera sp.]|nr:hypothetical protein [Isosphaera sp.]